MAVDGPASRSRRGRSNCERRPPAPAKGAAAQTPPLSNAQRRLVATSRALWVKSGSFVENGRYGARFGKSAKEAAALLEAIGYWHEPITGVYRHSPATPEFLERR